jgi:hypothetical protein
MNSVFVAILTAQYSLAVYDIDMSSSYRMAERGRSRSHGPTLDSVRAARFREQTVLQFLRRARATSVEPEVGAANPAPETTEHSVRNPIGELVVLEGGQESTPDASAQQTILTMGNILGSEVGPPIPPKAA